MEHSTQLTHNDLPQAVQELKQMVADLMATNNQRTPAESDSDLLGAAEASEFLGISKATLYQWTHRNLVPTYRVPGSTKIWFSRSGLTAWITGKEGAK